MREHFLFVIRVSFQSFSQSLFSSFFDLTAIPAPHNLPFSSFCRCIGWLPTSLSPRRSLQLPTMEYHSVRRKSLPQFRKLFPRFHSLIFTRICLHPVSESFVFGG